MISNIQILRAFAAINVVVYHIILASRSYSHPTRISGYLEGWGANGVDIFFVISGFIMLYTQMPKEKSPLSFLKQRTIRIVPIYWILTAFVTALFIAFPTLFREMVVTPAWVIASFTFTSSLFFEHPVVYVGWTLEWEMLFYILFAIGLHFNSWRALKWFVGSALLVVSVATKNPIGLEFLFGMMAAYLYQKDFLSRSLGVVLFQLGVILLLCSLIPFIRDVGMDRVLIWGVPAFFIVLGLVFSRQFKSPLLVYLGNASYSIYLVQMLAIPAFYKFSGKLLSSWNGDLLAAMCLLTSIVFGCVVYTYIERPSTLAIKKLAGG